MEQPDGSALALVVGFNRLRRRLEKHAAILIGEEFGRLRRQVNIAVLTGTQDQSVSAFLVDEFRLV